MKIENTVFMKAETGRIFALAADIGAWPRLLPHYRAVRVLEQSPDGCRKVAEMTAVRPNFPLPGVAFPVHWRCVQICEPERGRILFKHLAGVAIGMWVVWNLEPDPWGRGIRVSIGHQLTYPFAWLNGWFAGHLVGRVFVQAIAGRTLETFKTLVESEQKEPLS